MFFQSKNDKSFFLIFLQIEYSLKAISLKYLKQKQ